MPRLEPFAGVRIADRDDERGDREEDARDCAPARVRHELDDEEVGEQEDEQARVAVHRADDILPIQAHAE